MNVPICAWDENVAQYARNDGCGPKNIINTQIAEKQIHGLVEAPLHGDEDNQADVGHHYEDIDE